VTSSLGTSPASVDVWVLDRRRWGGGEATVGQEVQRRPDGVELLGHGAAADARRLDLERIAGRLGPCVLFMTEE
jgi:hypothetical protein